MAKIFSYILILNVIVQAIPYPTDDQQDIMVASSRLHQAADRFHRRADSIPNIMNFPSNNFLPRFQRNNNNNNYPIVAPQQHQKEEEEPETVYINMKIESDEEPETQYVNLFIDIKRKMNM